MTQHTDRSGPIAGGAVAVLLIAALFVKPWEGREYKVYRDVVGVLTACDGHTGGLREGQTFTDAQCDAFLTADLSEAYSHVTRCLPPTTPNRAAAFTSAAYNIGPRVVCGSTLQRKARAGDWDGACNELHRWNRGGGRVIRGLTRRRQAEVALCLTPEAIGSQ